MSVNKKTQNDHHRVRRRIARSQEKRKFKGRQEYCKPKDNHSRPRDQENYDLDSSYYNRVPSRGIGKDDDKGVVVNWP